MSTSDYNQINKLAMEDVAVLESKGRTYGDSWKSRGGVGAFMMLARKWDRIETICRDKFHYDVLSAGLVNEGDILDDIGDLRRYLLLVEDEIRQQANKRGEQVYARSNPLSAAVPADAAQATRRYVGQD